MTSLPSVSPRLTGAVTGWEYCTSILAVLRHCFGMVITRSLPPTRGTAGAFPSHTFALATVSPAVNSVTFSNSRKLHSSSRSLSSAR